jgi:lipoate synthase
MFYQDSPLVSVIKLISSESLGNIDVAKKYIDIESVYSEHINDSINYVELYEKQVKFKSNIDKSGKFTNQFKYYKYNINEVINKSNATVTFIDNENQIREIIYSLEKRKENWIVIGIQYIN